MKLHEFWMLGYERKKIDELVNAHGLYAVLAGDYSLPSREGVLYLERLVDKERGWRVCDHCGEIHALAVITETGDGEFVCANCADRYYVQCDSCGYLQREVRTVGGKHLCEDCFDEDYFVCYGCGEYFHRDFLNEADDECFCQNCYEDRYTTCDRCGCITSVDDSSYVEGDTVCNCCRDEFYRYCSRCGDYHDEDNGSYDDNDEWVCDRCANSVVLHNHGFSHKRRFIPYEQTGGALRVAENQARRLFLSAEIEMEFSGRNRSKYVEGRRADTDFYHLEFDGSLNEGVEVPTQGATLRAWQGEYGKLIDREILKPALALKATGHNSTCGLHTHSSKAAWSWRQIERGIDFFANQDNAIFFKFISQRQYGELSQWASLTEQGSTDTHTHFQKTHLRKTKKLYNASRYVAFNTQPDNTVEIRIMRGNLRLDRVLKAIEFHAAVWAYTRIDDSLSWQKFCGFLWKHKALYPNLIAFIQPSNFGGALCA